MKKSKRGIFYKIPKKKKTETEIFAFWVITFKQNMIQTCSAPQNDRWNLSFVKYSSWQKNDWKVIYQSQILVISLYLSIPTYLVII